ncbi:MAG: hypothetical protein ACKVOO_03785 [Burkholderiaceae bacterium]
MSHPFPLSAWAAAQRKSLATPVAAGGPSPKPGGVLSRSRGTNLVWLSMLAMLARRQRRARRGGGLRYTV